MIVQTQPPIHLTYCLNVHPGETWEENFAAIRAHALAVRKLVAPNRRFGLGMRLSGIAAGQLAEPGAMAAFRDFLGQENLCVFTINGFPYGQFHGTPVKEDVYRPDWRDPCRRDYTNALASILARLLPDGVEGSISTLPLSYRAWGQSEQDVALMVRMLADAAAFMDATWRQSGRLIRLAIEPEADCLIERTAELIAFFNGPLMTHGVPYLSQAQGITSKGAEQILRRHIGACLDTAHAAVAFESPADALVKLQRAGMTVAKVQLSSALAAEPTPEALRRLRDFCDKVYLHQVKVRLASGRMLSFSDLPDALASPEAAAAGSQWRIHFHVPLFFTEHEHLRSTSRDLIGNFATLLPQVCRHAEIETYTMGVLPDVLRPSDLAATIAKEFDWVLKNVLTGKTPPVDGGS